MKAGVATEMATRERQRRRLLMRLDLCSGQALARERV